MKKIAYVIPCYPVLSETFVSTEIGAMRELGHKIVPIALSKPSGEIQQKDKTEVADTYYFEDLGQLDALKGILRVCKLQKALQFAFQQQGMSTKSLLYMAAKLASVVAKEKCTHIHAHFAQATTAVAIVVGRLLDISVSFVSHGYDIYAAPADIALKLKATDFAVAVCEDMVSDYQAYYPEVNTELIYCGIDPDRFKPLALEQERNGKLLFIGRLCETKGVFDLVKAMAMVPEPIRPTLDIIGDGVLRDKLITEINEMKLAPWINLLGIRDSGWIAEHGPHYLALIGPFKQAENGDRDTGPVVVKEAMAMGLPVITTHFMGCKEIVCEQTGIKVGSGDYVALAKAIESFMKLDNCSFIKMALLARVRVTRLFTAKKQAETLSLKVESI